ncbi:MAG: hypothetical protein ACREF4_03605 [Gammaproteobacteria bacterium]
MSQHLVPFGKYKGQPVERIAEDKDYAEWLLAQDWFKNRFGPLYTVVINHGQEPVDTPEHNALQARFLDLDFRASFTRSTASYKDNVTNLLERATKNLTAYNDQYLAFVAQIAGCEDPKCSEYLNRVGKASERRYLSRCRACWEPLKNVPYAARNAYPPPLLEIEPMLVLGYPEFEREFVDVIFRATQEFRWAKEPEAYPQPCESMSWVFRIEIKPTIGDDFPAVLRQGYKRKSTHILCGRYTGVGATLPQVKSMFEASGFELIMLDEMQDSAPLPK